MKRSLHIGINDYPGTGNDLSGCVNDANDWQNALGDRGFDTSIILDSEATKARMIEEITKIVDETGRDDIAVITYSGHGTWTPDEDGDEADGRDEALCPHDTTEGNILKDDELYEIFCQRRRGARIIIISDSCHSGTVIRASSAMLGTPAPRENIQKIRYLAPEFYMKNDKARLLQAKRVEKIKATGKIRSAAVLLAGCKDEEYSYDAWFDGRPNGAFTYVALQTLKELPPEATYRDWYKKIREILPHIRYPQTPQLSGTWQQRAKWKIFKE